MNYRHAFHAGNFADVMKHALLCRVLLHLAGKDAPYRVVDTHAGIGSYNLEAAASAKTGEWREGVGRVLAANIPPDIAELLQPYLSCVRPLMARKPAIYPGSPCIALANTRPQDRLAFVEKHPVDVRALQARVAGDRRAKVLLLDGWTAWKAQVPPPERRGLVLVDPPFEEPGEFDRMVDGLMMAAKKWPVGSTLLWYPVKNPASVEGFHRALQETGIRKILRMELCIDRVDPDGPLVGSGLIAVNPPWKLQQDAETLLPWLARTMGRGDGASWRTDWITPE